MSNLSDKLHEMWILVDVERYVASYQFPEIERYNFREGNDTPSPAPAEGEHPIDTHIHRAIPFIQNIARKMNFRRAEDIDDFTGETVKTALANKHKYQGGHDLSQLKTWVGSVAYNVGRGLRKKAAVRQKHEPMPWSNTGDERSIAEMAVDPRNEQKVPLSDEMVPILKDIDELKDPVDKAVMRHRLQNMTSSQIAVQMGMTEANVRQRQKRVMDALRAKAQARLGQSQGISRRFAAIWDEVTIERMA